MPSLLEVFTSWRSLFDLAPEWVAVALGAQLLSWLSVWEVQRVALQIRGWFLVATSQLAGTALGRVIPGGAAAAGALQYRMLTRSGLPGGRIASALTATSLLLTGFMFALPVLSLPAVLAGRPVADGLARAAVLGAGLFVVMVVAGVAAFVWERPLMLAAQLAQTAVNATVRRRHHVEGLPALLIRERDIVLRAFGSRWKAALLAAGGKWIFDYLALLACLRAVGAEPRPSLVLLAFVAASFLAMIPLTPGGLGFVEAGLTGMLALADVAASAAVIATLVYRLVSFWLPIPAGALAYGLFRHRYP
jgi:uncharacterized protein (TIRG00374 family)